MTILWNVPINTNRKTDANSPHTIFLKRNMLPILYDFPKGDQCF